MLTPGLAATDCRLALALAIDVSRSVDEADYSVQRHGLASALRAPEVQAAFLRPGGHVALAVYEWSGKRDQQMVIPWTHVLNAKSLDGVADRIERRERINLQLPTGMGEALSFGRKLIQGGPDCAAQVLDISGDGQNNDGRYPSEVYADEDFSRIVVNGLPIGGHEADITSYYRAKVIHGHGAFVEPAPDQEDYPRAIRRKLVRELTSDLLGMLPSGSRSDQQATPEG